MEYTLRKPKATDIFVVSKIIKGIGLKNIKNCFNSDEINLIMKSVSGDKVTDDVLYKIGANIMLSIGDLILEKLDIVKTVAEKNNCKIITIPDGCYTIVESSWDTYQRKAEFPMEKGENII